MIQEQLLQIKVCDYIFFGLEVVNLIYFAKGKSELSISIKPHWLKEIDYNKEHGKSVSEVVL